VVRFSTLNIIMPNVMSSATYGGHFLFMFMSEMELQSEAMGVNNQQYQLCISPLLGAV